MRQSRTSFTLAAFVFLFITSTTLAESIPILRGFVNGTDPGVQLIGRAVGQSSPAIADLDGNTANGLEVVVGTNNAVVNAIRSDGTLMWSTGLPNSGCSGSADNKLISSPAVGALYGDGVPYVVIGYGGMGARDCDGGVAALQGSTGAIKWVFSIKAFSKRQKFWAFRYSVISTPALADTDGDGKMEIGFGSFDRNVYLLNYNGKPRWYYNAADTVWSSAAFVNVDKDPQLEMIIGTDISANKRLKPPTKDGGYVYAFKTKKPKRLKLSFRQKGAYVWATAFDQTIFSAPSIADFIPENPGLEIAVGSGCFFPQNRSPKRGAWVKILSLSKGKVLRILNTPTCLASSPAAGDLDGDGVVEVVASVNGAGQYGGSGDSRVMAWKASSSALLWEAIPNGLGSNDPYAGNYSSPVIADLDGNGSNEVIVANSRTINVFNGKDGRPLTCQSSSCSTSLVMDTRSPVRSTPAIADINNDGLLDLIIGGGSSGSGRIYGWSEFGNRLGSDLGSGGTAWPMYRGNAARDGLAR